MNKVGEESRDLQVRDTGNLAGEDREGTRNCDVAFASKQPSGLGNFVVDANRGRRSRPGEPIDRDP